MLLLKEIKLWLEKRIRVQGDTYYILHVIAEMKKIGSWGTVQEQNGVLSYSALTFLTVESLLGNIVN